MTAEESAKGEPTPALRQAINDLMAIDFTDTTAEGMLANVNRRLRILLILEASPAAERTALKELREWLVKENEGHKKSRKKFNDIDQKMACDTWIQANEWVISHIDAQERAGEP